MVLTDDVCHETKKGVSVARFLIQLNDCTSMRTPFWLVAYS